MFRRVLVSATAFALASLSLAATAVELVTTQLPRGVVPSYYDIAVTPHAETLTFDGAVTVALDVLLPTRHITPVVDRLIALGINAHPFVEGACLRHE